MSQVGLYSLCFVIVAGLAGAFTSGQTQLTLFLVGACAAIASLVAALIDVSANRARDRARQDYRARYGDNPPTR